MQSSFGLQVTAISPFEDDGHTCTTWCLTKRGDVFIICRARWCKYDFHIRYSVSGLLMKGGQIAP